jgi:predicted GH43/DUF377 family glycosyl hydrolase
MKKYIVSILIASVFLIGAPFLAPKTLAADLNIRDFINLLVAIGVITPDKMPAVNAFLATFSENENADQKIFQDLSRGFSLGLPSGWTYQKMSCNIDYIAFCPLKSGLNNCGMTCGANSPEPVIRLDYYQPGSTPKMYHSADNQYFADVNVSLKLSPNSREYFNLFRDIVDSFKIEVRESIKPSVPTVTVISPNGGERLKAGDNLNIKWKVTGAENFRGTKLSLIDLYGTVLADLNGETVTSVVIGNSVNGTNSSNDLGTGPGYNGSYIVKVCLIGNSTATTLCDSSNSYFNLTSLTSTPIINTPSSIPSEEEIVDSNTNDLVLNIASNGNKIIDSVNVYSPSVIFDEQENIYKMWYSGWISNNQTNDNIYYATSNDGINWTPNGTALTHGEGGSYDDIHVGDPSVVKFKNGVTGTYQYFMFYTVASSACIYPNCYGTIALAISSDGLTWTKFGRVIVPDIDDKYLNLSSTEKQIVLKIPNLIGVATPSVIFDNNEFKLYFNAVHPTYQDIGLVSSKSPGIDKFKFVSINNINFKNYPTNNYQFFLTGGGISNPEILKLDNDFVLFYDYIDSGKYNIGAAYSDDGINWDIYNANPIITPTGSNNNAITPFGLKKNGSQIMMYYGMNERQDLILQKIYSIMLDYKY